MRAATPNSSRTSRHAFTLIELVVVVAVLAILSAMVVPRLGGHEKRLMSLAVAQVADMLTMYAQRDALSNRPAGIWHDTDRNWLVLMTLDIDEANPEEPADWWPDPFVRPVKLPPLIGENGVFVRADGEPVDIRIWPLSTAPGQDRPAVQIMLMADDGSTRTLVLPGHAMAPYLLTSASDLTGVRVPVDLDAAGLRQEDW